MEGGLKDHLTTIILDCDECGKHFMSKRELKQHLFKHSTIRAYHCEFCLRTYKFASNLQQHKCPNKKNKKCPRLKSIVNPSERSTLNKMLRSKIQANLSRGFDRYPNGFKSDPTDISNRKEYECAECKTFFPNSRSLLKHSSIHVFDRAYLYACSNCTESFTQEKELIEHQTFHSSFGSWICDSCKGIFSSEESIKWHYDNSLECSFISMTSHQTLLPISNFPDFIEYESQNLWHEHQTYSEEKSINPCCRELLSIENSADGIDIAEPNWMSYGSGAAYGWRLSDEADSFNDLCSSIM